MMNQWFSAAALVINSSVPSSTVPGLKQSSPASSDPSLLLILFVMMSLAFVGLLITVIWNFRTGRWQSRISGFAGDVPETHQVRRDVSPPVSDLPSPADPKAPGQHSRSYDASTPSQRDGLRLEIAPPQPEEPLKNNPWLRLAEDCAHLFDELDNLAPTLDAPRQEMSRHVKNRLRAILIHSGVEPIAQDRTFDEARHQPERTGAVVKQGTPIEAVVSPGFAVERLVLRRAVVRVASIDQGQGWMPDLTGAL